MRYIKFTLLIYSFLLTWGITTNSISADEVTPTTTSETTVTSQSQSILLILMMKMLQLKKNFTLMMLQ